MANGVNRMIKDRRLQRHEAVIDDIAGWKPKEGRSPLFEGKEKREMKKLKRLAFAKRTLKTLKSMDKDTVALFEDEMSAGGSLRKGYEWTFDDRPVVKAPAYHMDRADVFGAVSPLTRDVIRSSSVSAKTPAFMKFLRR